jgi:16S rRNA (guanine966-N2)-methyltransferase
VRIIAGAFKGRKLKAPVWDGLRPTSDRLRETLFNVLAPRVPGARVFDGYAGTGALGIEALSRGAALVVAVDADARAVRLMRENASTCGAADYTTERGDAAGALLARRGRAVFDLILLDPPYAVSDTTAVLEAAAGCLAPGGLIVLERATRTEPQVPASLRRVRDIRSGDSSLTVLARAEPGTPPRAEPGTQDSAQAVEDLPETP